jgi:hypothetical protein
MMSPKTRHADWVIAVFLSLTAVGLHFFSLTHAGGLWRDELCMTNISGLPTLGQVWQTLPYDHCPIVFPVLLRLWSVLGFGETDGGLRILGLGIGLLLLATFWIASRMMGKGLPLLSVALAGLNFTIIRYGDSLRAYGLATVCLLLTMALIWHFMEAPNPGRGLMAGLGAVLCVQALYQNAFFLLGIGIAGATVCFRRGQYRSALAVLSFGAVAALSLLPYLPLISPAQSWWLLNRTGITGARFLNRITEATGILAPVWFALPIVAVLAGMGCFLTKVPRKETDIRQDLILFAGLALVIGLVGFGIFIKEAALPTRVWHYIPAMGFIVVCCDAILPRIHRSVHLLVLVAAVVAGSLAFSAALPILKLRQTNGDVVAALVSQPADRDDLIIVHPCYYGITFAHYYRGTTPWMTLPPLADYRFHRYDLFKVAMQETNAIEPVLEKVKTTLSSGHQVWLVGQLPIPQTEEPPADLPPAPYGPTGWADQPYSEVWGTQVSYFLLHHITNATLLVVTSTNTINPVEDMILVRTSGWRTSADNNPPN